MGTIKLLDTSTINKIAAGEVIERPFSVVKELLENAIDAGSSRVLVEIKDGGISYIRVTDNGSGIANQQVETAFTSHATSKLRDISDLNTINTLGFRGEALPSIASVSQIEITTKTNEEEQAAHVEIFGGEVINKREVAGNAGTMITMRNLFYNTPARKKFLKSPAVEAGYISDYISKIALSRPDISFRFINNGNEIVFTRGNNDLKTVIYSVYGSEYSDKLIEIDEEIAGLKISGYIAKPEMARSNRFYEDVFVNGRYVKDKIVQRAAEDAYKTHLPVGKFPAYVLNIEIEPKLVDVNAHPQKLELRFSDEDSVGSAVNYAVLNALSRTNLVQRTEILEEKPAPAGKTSYKDKALPQFYMVKEEEHFVLDKPLVFEDTFDEKDIFVSTKPETGQQEVIKPQKDTLFSEYKIIGQVFSTYWIVEQTGGKLFIIDQHAAHERILFEKFLLNLKSGSVVSQILMIPESLNLTEGEKSQLLENMDIFTELGFEIKDFCLESVPNVLSGSEKAGTVKEILDLIRDGAFGAAKSDIYDIRLNAVATLACKAAVKANNRLKEKEANEIIQDLLKLENPFTCPHGRPTIIEMTKYEIEKMFKRIQ